jgi:hypothetical protein
MTRILPRRLRVTRITSIFVAFVFAVALAGCDDSIEGLVKMTGYLPVRMMPTENSFGLGSILVRQPNGEILILAKGNDCFPGIASALRLDQVLLTSVGQGISPKQGISLKQDQAKRYVFQNLEEVGHALGLIRVSGIVFRYSKITGNDLTLSQFTRYIEERTISRGCGDFLRRGDARVVMSTAVADGVLLQVIGDKQTPSQDVSELNLQTALLTNEIRNIELTSERMIRIGSPLVIGYKAIALQLANAANLPDGTIRLYKEALKISNDPDVDTFLYQK